MDINEYDGDVIRLDRLIEFIPSEHWEWDSTGKITLDDISDGIQNNVKEISEPYGDTWKYPALEENRGSGILEE